MVASAVFVLTCQFDVCRLFNIKVFHSDSKIRGWGPRRLEECSQVSSNILIVFEKRWERTQKRWEYVKKDGSIHKKRKKMEVSIIKEGWKKMEVYIKKMVFLFEKKRWMKDKRWIKDGNRPSGDSPTGIGASLRTHWCTDERIHGRTEGWEDVKVEIVI